MAYQFIGEAVQAEKSVVSYIRMFLSPFRLGVNVRWVIRLPDVVHTYESLYTDGL